MAWGHACLKTTSSANQRHVRTARAERHNPWRRPSPPGYAAIRMPTADPNAPRRRPSAWALVVAGSAVVILGCTLVLGGWWLASSEKQVATYSVRGAVNRVTLDL